MRGSREEGEGTFGGGEGGDRCTDSKEEIGMELEIYIVNRGRLTSELNRPIFERDSRLSRLSPICKQIADIIIMISRATLNGMKSVSSIYQ